MDSQDLLSSCWVTIQNPGLESLGNRTSPQPLPGPVPAFCKCSQSLAFTAIKEIKNFFSFFFFFLKKSELERKCKFRSGSEAYKGSVTPASFDGKSWEFSKELKSRNLKLTARRMESLSPPLGRGQNKSQRPPWTWSHTERIASSPSLILEGWWGHPGGQASANILI